MDVNQNDTTFLSNNTIKQGSWKGDTRSCEQGQIIYGCVTFNNRPININDMDRNEKTQPIKTSVSSDSSASSDGSTGSKTMTWGQLSSSGPKQSLIGSNSGQRSPEKSRPNTLEKNKNRKMMTWKDVSPTKSALGSDLEGSGNANVINEHVNKGEKLTNQITDNEKCDCKAHSTTPGSPCKKGHACLCSKQCLSHRTENDNETSVTRSSGSSNDNGSPRKERICNPGDDGCNNDYFYDEDFSVQFDTNLRETSVTPVDVEPTPTILDFPHMVTGSYLSFNNGGSSNASNASYNNMRESASLGLSNVPPTCAALHFIQDRSQYDSEFSGNSGNSGSRNSAMELSSSEREMMCSSDMIDFSDGPLFTPTPTHILSTDSLDRNTRELQGQGQGSEMNNSNTSADANLNVDCCPRKEDYFLSFDGSNTRVSGSETDISLSATSHDSGQGHWNQSETSTSGESGAVYHLDGVGLNVSSSENQEESSDSFHFCSSNKLSPLHRQPHHLKDSLTGRIVKRLVPVTEAITESTDSSEEEPEGNTSTTLTAGSKEVSSISPQTSPQKQLIPRPLADNVNKGKQTFKKKGQKLDNLILVGIGKPSDLLRKAQYHSHTLPAKNLVSWKQMKNMKKVGITDCTQSKSLPELSSNSTSWQSISSLKCRKISDISDSFHGKRHSASLLEFYQRMKSESNPVSPETMNNLEQILLPDFIGQKQQEMSDSSASSLECTQCQCQRQKLCNGMDGSLTKALTNKRVSDWLKKDCTTASQEGRPSSLGCQTTLLRECATKETLISPHTVTLWCGTKNAASQFPPVTKDCSIQTLKNSAYKDCSLSTSTGTKDQGLQTSDFDTDDFMSILSENYDEYQFLTSNEGIARDLERHMSCPENFKLENGIKSRVPRSKSADEYRNYQKYMSPYEEHLYSYPGQVQGRSRGIGRSRLAGGLRSKSESPLLRMGYSSHYSYNSMPDIAFLMSSSSSLNKEESKESLFDPLKIDLPTPVFIKPKTELEKIDIYNQKASPCVCHKPLYCSEHKTKSSGQRNVHQVESASSSSGFSTSSSSGIDPGYCQCDNYYSSSPQNDLERLIFFPPHTSNSRKPSHCCWPKKRAHSVPKCLSEFAGSPQGKFEKYTNENYPQSVTKGQGQARTGQKRNPGLKLVSAETNPDNLYALEEEQTPVASPEQNCCHSEKCPRNSCHGNKNYPSLREEDVCERDFYRATGRVFHIDKEYLRDFSTDSASSSGSYIPNNDKKPLKSCLRKKNKGLRTRSMSDTFNLSFDDAQQMQKKKNRHSYACDEVYIIADEFGQLMMCQADDAAEPVMFYLDKDGECHMTEGVKPEFDVVPNEVTGSDSSGSSEKESSNKRKSVSFASEVSFQAISPTSPKRQIVAAASGSCDQSCDCTKEVEKNQETGEKQTEPTDTEKVCTTTGPTADLVLDHQSNRDSGCHSNNSSSSSSEGAPEEFQVAMDTNENNLWTKDVMDEKLGLLNEVIKAADILVEHFAHSNDFFDKLRLGNGADTPLVGDLVLSTLCPALSHIISNGMKPHLAGFQMFGRVQVTIWKVVEASVETGQQTRTLTDLVTKIKQTTYLTTHQQKFDAFVFGLLNYRLLDFWVSSVRAKEDQLSRYYEPDAILLHSNTVLKAKYDSLILSVQPLATLPFQLHSEFIRDKALMDSKMKSQEMANSKDELVASTNQIQGNNSLNEPITESVPTEVTSVLELTATKALNWITKTALPKLSPHEYSPSKSKSLPLELSSHVTDSPTNEMADSFNRIQRETKSLNDIEKLMEKHKNVYCDAKSSRIDSDHIISPSESMRSSLGSQYGPLSFFSNFTSRFDTSKTENTDNQSILSPSMTSSVTSLVNKFFQFGANLSQRQAYRKGVTEYNFEDQSEIPEEKPGSSEKVENEKDSDDADQILKEKIISDPVVDLTENQSVPKTDTKEDNKSGHKSKVPSPSKRAGFDIVNLFDKLLLPSTKDSGVKPVKESKSRWSWGLGSKQDVNKAKVKKLPKSKIPVTLNRNQSAKSTDTTSKNSSCKMAAGVTPPPKPPRLIPEDSKSGKGNTRGVTQSSSPTSETNYDVGSNSASV